MVGIFSDAAKSTSSKLQEENGEANIPVQKEENIRGGTKNSKIWVKRNRETRIKQM